MTIDFHHPSNRGTYASRIAEHDWALTMQAIVGPRFKIVADIGCGGGIYSRAWSDLGAAAVHGIDFSAQMVADAIEASADYPHLSFSQATATQTGLADDSMDIAFERALIHHLPDLEDAFTEAYRILRPGGVLIVQDRTIEDVMQPASPEHFRGYFFEAFPRLLEVERNRRPSSREVADAMTSAGFGHVSTTTVPETRRAYRSLEKLQADLRGRTGRSILHELSDTELEELIASISNRVEDAFPLVEMDVWTVWSAHKPG